MLESDKEELNKQRKEIFNTSLDHGCCIRCSLRFIGLKYIFGYEDLSKDIQMIGETLSINEERKKQKLNPCVTCLDILRESFIEDVVKSSELKKVYEYDEETFINFLTVPIAVSLRMRSMEIFLKEKFPDYFAKEYFYDPLNKIWTKAITSRLEKTIEKRRDDTKESTLHIHFTFTYEHDAEESTVISQLNKNFKNKTNFSRNNVTDALLNVKDEDFKKIVTIPPQIPNKSVETTQITITHEPIHIAGRYCKYSRDLGQTPWTVDKKTECVGSVQEFIFDVVKEVFKSDDLVFSASGREDYDVRTLGKGRPFLVRINDPKVTKVTYSQFREIEKKIRKNTNKVEVKELQLIEKKLLPNIKMGEQDTRKTYRALCCVSNGEQPDNYVEIINKLGMLTIAQKTPIRVLHRRSVGTRMKKIHSIVARLIKNKSNLIEIDLSTQAGTYIKEFVHGDCGRTKPSLRSILGTDIDIIALDVLEIHIDFPPGLTENNSNAENIVVTKIADVKDIEKEEEMD